MWSQDRKDQEKITTKLTLSSSTPKSHLQRTTERMKTRRGNAYLISGFGLAIAGSLACWVLAIVACKRPIVIIQHVAPPHVEILSKGLQSVPNYVLAGTMIALAGIVLITAGILRTREKSNKKN